MKEKQNIFRKKTERYTCCDENGHDSNFYSYFMQKIGNNVRIGANAIVCCDIPDNSTVVLEKSRVILHNCLSNKTVKNAFEYFKKTLMR